MSEFTERYSLNGNRLLLEKWGEQEIATRWIAHLKGGKTPVVLDPVNHVTGEPVPKARLAMTLEDFAALFAAGYRVLR